MRFISSSSDSTIRKWSLETLDCLAVISCFGMGDVLSLAIIGDQLFAGFQDTRIRNMTLDLIESKVSSPSLLRSIDDTVWQSHQ